MIEIIMNQKDTPMINFEGFLFTIKNKYAEKIIWRCRLRSCKALIHTPIN
jgi:hypothetical protein